MSFPNLHGSSSQCLTRLLCVQIKTIYYKDVEKLLERVTGGTRVHIFDHTLRKGTIKNSKK